MPPRPNKTDANKSFESSKGQGQPINVTKRKAGCLAEVVVPPEHLSFGDGDAPGEKSSKKIKTATVKVTVGDELRAKFSEHNETDSKLRFDTVGGQQDRIVITIPRESKAKPTKDVWPWVNGNTVIRGPRSFKGRRPKQVLRWISTVAFVIATNARQQPEEIQCGYFPGSETNGGKRFYISSNNNTCNRWLESRYFAKTVTGMLEDMIADVAKNKIIDAKGKDYEDRFVRHLKHIQGLLGNKFIPEIDACIDRTTPVLFPDGLSELKPGTVAYANGLHAERRIGLTATKLNLTGIIIAGLKRPCSACWLSFKEGDLGSWEDCKHLVSPPGPMWVSGAALSGRTADEWFELVVANLVPTHLTKTKGGDLTTNGDSDSESDEESWEPLVVDSPDKMAIDAMDDEHSVSPVVQTGDAMALDV